MDGLTGRAPRFPLSIVAGPAALRRWAVVTLAVNVLIVVTGAIVRLTGSGLGCPTWPRCDETSYVTHPALGVHGWIEFGNRLLTFLLVVVALATWVSALLHRDPTRPARGGRRRDLRWLAGLLALGIPVQAVIGGISVLVQLNPYVVAVHLLVSMVLIALSVWLLRRAWHLVATAAPPHVVAVARLALAAIAVAVALGTLVTGSGPHAGDADVPRTGFDGALVTHVHAAAVYVAVGLTVLSLWFLRSRAALTLLVVEVAQGVVGVVQYHLGLPIWLVGLHLLGASLSVAAAMNLALSVRRAPRPVPQARELVLAAESG